jgi:hypothetical protein
MCVNNYKSCLTGYITLWNLLCSLTLKMFISLQLGGSIWYHLIWIGNSRNINKIIYPNLLPLTSERVLFKPCWYGIVFFLFCLEVSCWDIHFQDSAHVTDQIVNTFSSLRKKCWSWNGSAYLIILSWMFWILAPPWDLFFRQTPP